MGQGVPFRTDFLMEPPAELKSQPILTLVPKTPSPPEEKNKAKYAPAVLTSRQLKAVELLIQHKTNQEVAETLNLNVRTIGKWKEMAIFKAALGEEYQKDACAQFNGKELTDDEIKKIARNTLISGVSRNPKLAFEYLKECGEIRPVSVDDGKPVVIQFGELCKDDAEVEDMLRVDLPAVPKIEATYIPKDN